MLTLTCRDRRAVNVTVVAASALLGVLILSVFVLPASPAAASSKTGYVRLAHLSPDTPKVDVYLDSLSSKQKEQRFPGVGYGTVSGYLPLPIGAYAISMRASGAPPTSKPVLTTTVTVVANHAYTVAGVGRYADLGLRVINDDLSSPMNGQARVRVVQASIRAPLLDVSIGGGASVATHVAFATTTSYALVSAGVVTLRVRPSDGGTTTLMHVTLQPDSVYSVLVLDGKSKLTAQLLMDAGHAGPIPAGGVNTGAGGMAPKPNSAMPAIVVAAVAMTLSTLLAVYGRPRSAWWSSRNAASRLR